MIARALLLSVSLSLALSAAAPTQVDGHLHKRDFIGGDATSVHPSDPYLVKRGIEDTATSTVLHKRDGNDTMSADSTTSGYKGGGHGWGGGGHSWGGGGGSHGRYRNGGSLQRWGGGGGAWAGQAYEGANYYANFASAYNPYDYYDDGYDENYGDYEDYGSYGGWL